MIKSHYFPYSEKKINFKLKSVQVMVRNIFISGKNMVSFLLRDDNIFARNENIGKICKPTITWLDFSLKLIFFSNWEKSDY